MKLVSQSILPPEEELLEEFKSGSIPRSETWQTLINGLYLNNEQVAEIEEWYNTTLGLSEQNQIIHAKIQVQQDQIEVWHGDVDLWQKQASAEKDIAVSSAAAAKNSEQAAAKSDDLARRWATEEEGKPVEDNEFSSLHWAKVAERIGNTITNGMYFAGSWDLSNGFPPSPKSQLVPWYRIIGSDISSFSTEDPKLSKLAEQANKGDQLIWDPIRKEWFKLDTTDKVWSVNGHIGSVELDADDVGARPDSWLPTADDVGALPNSTKQIDNVNDIQDTGFYRTVAGSKNNPTDNRGYVIQHITYIDNSKRYTQMAFRQHSGLEIYVRSHHSDSWSKWYQVYTSQYKPSPDDIGAEPTLTTDRKRKITISTSNPYGGSDGDIWFKVE